jgi:O-antigen/teichoic acid export membrane protein
MTPSTDVPASQVAESAKGNIVIKGSTNGQPVDAEPIIATQATQQVGSPRWGRGSSGAARARLVNGSMIMLISSGLVGAINLLYNLAIAHTLGAASFGHATAVYTLLMLLSAVTLSFQLLCSKLIPQNDSFDAKAAIYRLLHKRSWFWGAGVSLLLVVASGVLTGYLNLPNRNYVLLLSIGTTFYVPLGVRRGLMQGTYDFFHLALNYVFEVVIKLIGTLVFIHLGFGVQGVIAAIVGSIILPYFLADPPLELRRTKSRPGLNLATGEGMQASVFFIGQVIINNLDIVLVKHFFNATEAGVYAAVSLVGRIVYMLSWSVVSSMFPISAGVRSREKDGRAVLSATMLIVVGITSLFTFCVWLAPAQLWHAVLGAGFPLGAQNPYASLLVLYAATTGIYSLCVVLMSYEISRKIGNVSWLQLGFSAAIICGIYLFHDTLKNVIEVQLTAMFFLLGVVSVPFLRFWRAKAKVEEQAEVTEMQPQGIVKLHKVSEDQVIAEFLKSEFYMSEFEKYHEKFDGIVNFPNLDNRHENVIRKALLFKRRGRMWRELPEDTEWYEIHLQPNDLHQLRIFPRSQWRKVADDSYYLADIIERLRAKIAADPEDSFSQKLQNVCDELSSGRARRSAILMIGIDENNPITIIEGNHRMAAANLLAPMQVPPYFTFLCGFSPRMMECCWYQTDLSTLWKYAKNTMAFYFEDPDSAIAKAMPNLFEGPGSDPSIGPA